MCKFIPLPVLLHQSKIYIFAPAAIKMSQMFEGLHWKSQKKYQLSIGKIRYDNVIDNWLTQWNLHKATKKFKSEVFIAAYTKIKH